MGILRKKDLTFALLALLLNASCWPTNDLKHFTLYGETKNVDPKKLNINGVYYRIERKESNRVWKYDHIRCMAFYSNGTFLNLFSNEIKLNVGTAIREIIEDFEVNKKRYSNYLQFWGAYKIVQDSILIQWYRTDLGGPKQGVIAYTARVYEDQMKIQNDTTLFEIRDESKTYYEKYHLYKTQKPDSTNIFMTNAGIKRKLERLYKKRHQ